MPNAESYKQFLILEVIHRSIRLGIHLFIDPFKRLYKSTTQNCKVNLDDKLESINTFGRPKLVNLMTSAADSAEEERRLTQNPSNGKE